MSTLMPMNHNYLLFVYGRNVTVQFVSFQPSNCTTMSLSDFVRPLAHWSGNLLYRNLLFFLDSCLRRNDTL